MQPYHWLHELIAIDSPTGFTERASAWLADTLSVLGWSPQVTPKGTVRCALGDAPRLALTAHIDTLGAMVCGLRDDGALRISPIGGLSLNMAEGEYVTVYTLDGRQITGTFLLDNPSAHANRELAKAERNPARMHVRLDADVRGPGDTRALGIRPGDAVCFDPRYQALPSGFIKSRFLDDKAGCYVLLELARRLAGRSVPVELLFSSYEEVGHGGAAGYGPAVEELLVVDMGVIGDACMGRETCCSICAKDSSGPYDLAMRRTLVRLAEDGGIPHEIDVYPYYGSDGSVALRAGHDFRVALIGPGVAASHGVERTHRKGIEATVDLCMAYIGQLA